VWELENPGAGTPRRRTTARDESED